MQRAHLFRIVAIAAAACTTGGCNQRNLYVVDGNPTTVSTVEFGVLPVGGRKVLAVPVENVGGAPLTVSAVAAPPFSVDGAPPDPIQPGSKGYLMVAYEPSAAGEAATALVLATSSIDVPTLSVALHGSSYAADLTADPARLDFGEVQVRSFRTLSVRLANSTLATLNPSVERVGGTDFAAAPIGALDAIGPLQETTIEVTFAPTMAGPAGGRLSYTCATCPVRQIELTGTGIGDATGVDGGTPGDGGASAGCSLAVSPGRLDFGPVALASTSSGTVEVRSIGSATCLLARPFFDSTTDPAFSSPPLAQMQLAPGASASIRVDLKPVAATPALISGALLFASNDPQHPAQRVVLSAAVPVPTTAGRLAVSPTSLSFVGQVKQPLAAQDVKLSNAGTGGLAWTAVSDDPTVSLSATTGTLAPGGLLALAVAVLPQSAAGTRVQHVVVDAGAAGKAVVQITISTSETPVDGAAKLVVLPPTLSFTATPGGTPHGSSAARSTIVAKVPSPSSPAVGIRPMATPSRTSAGRG